MAAKTGRRSKGDRAPATYTRPHRLVRQAAEQAAADEGYDSLSDYISAALADHLGMQQYAPQPQPERRRQKELPLVG